MEAGVLRKLGTDVELANIKSLSMDGVVGI